MLDYFNGLTSAVKGIIIGVLAVFCISVGYGIADTLIIKPLKKDLKIAQMNLASAIDANQSNSITISNLKTEISKKIASCDKRLKIKDNLRDEIIKTCGLIPIEEVKEGETNVADGSVLSNLNSLFD